MDSDLLKEVIQQSGFGWIAVVGLFKTGFNFSVAYKESDNETAE
jgi:hypothetical protein